ncbi:MAG: hypothetical protein KGZ58_10545 [Ignavibacteriales bacterium]|nr:hypothetical protein [Ignavibacteriales bacterium]
MLAIKGIYDGKHILPLEKLPNKKKKYHVLITFVEEINDEENVRAFASHSNAFAFWEDTREDVYQDYIGKKKK